MATVYASTKIFHFPDRLAAVAAGEVPAPVHIRLKPTNRCNHRCHYCCYRNENLFLSQLMHEADQIPRAKMAELVRDLGQMGVKAVTFSGGGEPLCYPHISETIDGLAAAGVKIAMLSNGGLLCGDAAEREGYAKSRGVSPAEFDKVCANIRTFAATPGRQCVLGLNLIVTRDNSPYILDFLKLTKDLGVDHVKVSGVVVSTEPAANDAYHAPIYDTVRRQLDQAKATLPDARFAIVDLLHEPNSTATMYLKGYHWCPMSRFLVVVAADQHVYTCQDKAYTVSGQLGSIREVSFREMWQSRATADRLKALDPSRDCPHHCVAHSKNLMLLEYFGADPGHLEFV